MKSLKVLLLMAGLSNALVASAGSSTLLVASEGTADKVVNGYAAQVMNYLGSFGSYVTTKGFDAYSAVSTQAGKCANGTVELAKSGYNTVATKAVNAGSVVASYAQAGVYKASETAKAGFDLGKSGVDSSVAFIQENPKTVGVVAAVATVAAVVAAYRKMTLGYVFYAAQTDKN